MYMQNENNQVNWHIADKNNVVILLSPVVKVHDSGLSFSGIRRSPQVGYEDNDI